MAFHEVRFPTDIAFRSLGGPTRRTIIVQAASGGESRNALWANSRRRYDVGHGVKSLQDLYQVIEFFEERRGRLHAFRFKDRTDFRSKGPNEAPAFDDVEIGTGNGVATTFQLIKTYGSAYAPWSRTIKKPVTGTVKIGVNGVERGSGWTVDVTTGIVTFSAAPGNGLAVTAGFEFDVPARFDADELEIDLVGFEAGRYPVIPIIEVLL